MKLQYSVLSKRYADFKVEYSQIIKENAKLKETAKKREKTINELKKEVLELGYLLSVRLDNYTYRRDYGE